METKNGIVENPLSYHLEKKGNAMFNKAEMELFMKTKGMYFENETLVTPKYGIIYSITNPMSKTIESVGIIDFPINVSEGKLPVGHDIIRKEEVITNTKKGIRYTTITKTLFDPWVPGQLVHTDGDCYISTNPNETSKDNLNNLALGEHTPEEIREILSSIAQGS